MTQRTGWKKWAFGNLEWSPVTVGCGIVLLFVAIAFAIGTVQ